MLDWSRYYRRAEDFHSAGGGGASSNSTSGLASSASHHLIMRTFSCGVRMVLISAAIYFGMTSAQCIFSVPSTGYNCSSNLICMGQAHSYSGDSSNGLEDGMLSLLTENFDKSMDLSGLAYYKEPVKLLDPATRQPASFNTSFTIYNRNGSNHFKLLGDGMAFVISANNSTLGTQGGYLGIFDGNGSTSFKSIVVEFDTFLNGDPPENDISDNHVSLDFMNITWVAAANASDVNVDLCQEVPVYAWVEYSMETKKLELRISFRSSRPVSPLLNYTVNLSDFVDEYMWVGFSSGAGDSFSNHYVGDWTFESSLGACSPVPNKSKLGMILGISVGVPSFVLAWVMIAFFVQRCGCRRPYRNCQVLLGFIKEEDEMIQIEGMPERFTYKQLSVATKQFNEESKLGQGGFGSVYGGVLPSSGIPVAVKKIKRGSAQGQKEFMAEVSIVSQLRHRNLIQILGWCKNVAKMKYLLVYELMPNGSLDKALFEPGLGGRETACLSWQKRLNIVTGTAAALDYLHQGWKQQVIHRDIKSSNIMLDREWNAKLGDFGLARLVDHENVAATTVVAGTYGYIAPEAAVSGHFTDKTDVFAFGAVILEVACGRRALLSSLPPEEVVLVDWVWQKLSEGALLSTVDKRVRDYDTYWIEVVLVLGLLCSHPNPLARPSMRHVVQVLAGDAQVPSIPTSKPALFSSESQTSVEMYEFQDSKSSSTFTSRSGSISLVCSKNFSDTINESSGSSSKSTSSI